MFNFTTIPRLCVVDVHKDKYDNTRLTISFEDESSTMSISVTIETARKLANLLRSKIYPMNAEEGARKCLTIKATVPATTNLETMSKLLKSIRLEDLQPSKTGSVSTDTGATAPSQESIDF